MKHFFLLSDKKRSVRIDAGKSAIAAEEIPEPLYPYEHDVNTLDGGEFLDDGIRMNEQPLGERTSSATSPGDITSGEVG